MIRARRGVVHVRSRLVGRPNVYNILGAVGTALELDIPIAAIEEGLQRLPGVPGGFEVVSAAADDVTVVVDYAHRRCVAKPAAAARPMAASRLITVFGAGGDRDRTKRPLMGMVAARLSDVVVIVDNPRGEDRSGSSKSEAWSRCKPPERLHRHGGRSREAILERCAARIPATSC